MVMDRRAGLVRLALLLWAGVLTEAKLSVVGGDGRSLIAVDSLPEVLSFEWERVFRAPGSSLAYPGPEQRAAARLKYLATVALIVAHNERADRGLASHRLGVNHFSDLTPDEFTRLISRPMAVPSSASPVAEASAKPGRCPLPPLPLPHTLPARPPQPPTAPAQPPTRLLPAGERRAPAARAGPSPRRGRRRGRSSSRRAPCGSLYPPPRPPRRPVARHAPPHASLLPPSISGPRCSLHRWRRRAHRVAPPA